MNRHCTTCTTIPSLLYNPPLHISPLIPVLLLLLLTHSLLPAPHLTAEATISWLAISHTGSHLQHPYQQQGKQLRAIVGVKPAALCRRLPGLTRKQMKWCRNNLSTMDSVKEGAKDAYGECQYQFAKRRWNCTMIDLETKKVFGDVVLKDGTREAAFVHAM